MSIPNTINFVYRVFSITHCNILSKFDFEWRHVCIANQPGWEQNRLETFHVCVSYSMYIWTLSVTDWVVGYLLVWMVSYIRTHHPISLSACRTLTDAAAAAAVLCVTPMHFPIRMRTVDVEVRERATARPDMHPNMKQPQRMDEREYSVGFNARSYPFQFVWEPYRSATAES